ncbi:hypothetical protein LINPERHAP1_LOCUS12726, partial [Linum perenne]
LSFIRKLIPSQFLVSGSRGSESESKIRCTVEFSGVAGWTCEGKIRGLLWSDHYFGFMFQLTFLGWEIL